jgi:CMP-N-acetylneuraminic acid synthetase
VRDALAIILARAGSKGLPGKNSMPIAGKPCAAWTIEHALAAKAVSRVVLSTDDPRLKDLARSMGVRVVDRSAALASDAATVDAAAREAVQALGELSSRTPIVLLYANVPVRPVGLIDRAVSMLLETGCDSVQSYAPVGKMHPWWTARVESETGRVAAWEGDVLNHGVFRRQDLPPAYIPDGGVLVVTRRALFCEIPTVPPGPHAFFGLDRRGVVTGEGEVVDIDSRVDAMVADAIIREHEGALA